ncbi:haloacid dehalogenase type II [Saccharolobus solfataricus]|uniref:Haloacetate dehalogenase n=3 Tax=Saccharolobus solfataricus TaxID=2287 RepID=Q97YZ1_SACS2|nr:haloacid dehalogenase type II [Saccharolobus solfataricus]AAK41409.1 Haloacetate dehalogenase [Saccharolobus solfataricus P2]AKA75111.1 haloacid dehalogenase type II [Saccharolobus solfataricus]AKA77805.1 haloacid dehalogenase type II [Saccharolobus solfataricus]AKA80499.1 haloacid dehalogenase type II [Saccharolobus solfataricus]AZF69558.1 haloacid dehalogenase type II [Saccharolobus solfataricus]
MGKEKKILAFDLYGTILDLSAISQEMRRKQLEYTWLLTIMGRYVDFDEITKIAISYTLGEDKIEEELNKWRSLRTHQDAIYLKDISTIADIYILSNGTTKTIEELLKLNGLSSYFKGIFSAERVKEYKPSPKVYRYFLEAVKGEAYLVSSNPFDVIGAKNSGMKGIYVNRRNMPVDPLGYEPDVVVRDFKELYEWLQK